MKDLVSYTKAIIIKLNVFKRHLKWGKKKINKVCILVEIEIARVNFI